MKKMHLLLLFVALAVVSFALAGCPKDDKMMKGDLSRPDAVQHVG